MLTWLRDFHIAELGGQDRVAGRGIFSNGPAVSGMVQPVAPQGSKLPGYLGKEIEFDNGGLAMVQAAFNALSSTTQTLYPCRLQLVQTKAGSTVTPVVGTCCFWATVADQEAYIATPDVPAQTGAKFAGVYIYTPNAKGDYVWIATQGEVSAFASHAAGAAASGDLLTVVQDASNSNQGRFQTSAAPTTIAILSALVARLLDASLSNDARAKVELVNLGFRSI